MSRPWMPLYVADYLGDTQHLSTIEHGAYMLLIMQYWQKGGLPDDETQLMRIARMTQQEWTDAAPTLQRLFKQGWQHPRIEGELALADEKIEKKSEAGKKGGRASALARKQAKLAKLKADANQPSTDAATSASTDASSDRSTDDAAKSNTTTTTTTEERIETPNHPSGDSPPIGKTVAAKPKRTPNRPMPDEADKADIGFRVLHDTFIDSARKLRVGDAENEFGRFIDHHRAKGSVFADWHAAGRTWLRNSIKFNSKPGSSGGGGQRANGGFTQFLVNRAEQTNGTVTIDHDDLEFAAGRS